MFTAMVLTLVTFGMVLALPFLLLAGILKLVLGLLLLPLKIVGVVFRVVFGVFGLLAKIFFSGLGLILGLAAVLLGFVFLPLLPLFLLGFLVWAAVKAFEPPAMRVI